MLSVKHKFYQPHPLDKPIKLLTEDEKKDILEIYYRFTRIHNILINDPICIELGAKEDDIIAIRNKTSETYRLVVKDINY